MKFDLLHVFEFKIAIFQSVLILTHFLLINNTFTIILLIIDNQHLGKNLLIINNT